MGELFVTLTNVSQEKRQLKNHHHNTVNIAISPDE